MKFTPLEIYSDYKRFNNPSELIEYVRQIKSWPLDPPPELASTISHLYLCAYRVELYAYAVADHFYLDNGLYPGLTLSSTSAFTTPTSLIDIHNAYYYMINSKKITEEDLQLIIFGSWNIAVAKIYEQTKNLKLKKNPIVQDFEDDIFDLELDVLTLHKLQELEQKVDKKLHSLENLVENTSVPTIEKDVPDYLKVKKDIEEEIKKQLDPRGRINFFGWLTVLVGLSGGWYLGGQITTYIEREFFLLSALNIFVYAAAFIACGSIVPIFFSTKKLSEKIETDATELATERFKKLKTEYDKRADDIKWQLEEIKSVTNQLQKYKELKTRIDYLKAKARARERSAKLAAYEEKARIGSDTLKRKILDFTPDKTTCPYCKNNIDKSQMHLDHIHPVSNGGLSVMGNVVLVCANCNIKKSNKTLRIFCKENDYDFFNLCDRLERMGKDV